MNQSARKTPRFTVVLPTHNRADVCRSPFAAHSGRRCRTSSCSSRAMAAPMARGRSSGPSTIQGSGGLICRRRRGIGYANRNAVLREARGGNVAYLAHDDIWFPDHLERLGVLLDRSGVEFAYTRGLGVDLEGRILPYWYNLNVARHQAGLWRGDSAITIYNRRAFTRMPRQIRLLGRDDVIRRRRGHVASHSDRWPVQEPRIRAESDITALCCQLAAHESPSTSLVVGGMAAR